MADITNLSNFLGDVADAIRTKKETTEPIPAENFDQEILSIETGVDTSDATATAEDIVLGQTAYVNGEKITGTLIPTENLQEQLDAQDVIIQQLEQALENKAQVSVKPNVFMQEDEPTTKDGIWLKGNYEVNNIKMVDNVFGGEEWNNTKMDSLKSIPYSCAGNGVVAIGTNVYLFGSLYSGYKNYAYKYDILTDTYTKLTDVPYELAQGSAVAIGTNIYIFGTNKSDTEGKNAYKYDTLTNTYTKLTDVPIPISASAVVAIGENVYFMGTFKSTYRKNVYKYDTTTDKYTQLSDMPYEFCQCGAATIGTNVYMFGSGISANQKYAYKYDTITGTYTRLADIPYNYYNCTPIAVGTNIYLFGSGDDNYNKYAYKYDTLTNTYIRLADSLYSVSHVVPILCEGFIYLFGGAGSPTKVQVMELIQNEYPEGSILITENTLKNETKIANFGIENAKFYYDKVYYNDTTGKLLKDIPVYNGNGTEWIKISGGEG